MHTLEELATMKRARAHSGYRLVLMRDHQHAFSNGYLYEHRAVMEAVIGRYLTPKEQVHHINGDSRDNRPENLALVESMRMHRLLHRCGDRPRRMPGEPNTLIRCSCGCGEVFSRYDSYGRPRLFVSGHNMHPREAKNVA